MFIDQKVRQRRHTQAGSHQFGDREHAVAAIGGHHAGEMLAAPGYGGVIREEIVRCDPGHGSQVIRIHRAQIRGTGTYPVSHVAQVSTDQVFRRRTGQA
ncbi:hypothetical protein D3C76_1253920 [compost metagenome]